MFKKEKGDEMDGLLVVERMIVESLEKKGRSFYEIHEDTGINLGALTKLLDRLINRGILLYKKGFYWLNRDPESTWIKEINRTENLKDEVSEVMHSLIDVRFEKSDKNKSDQKDYLKLQKIWLTKEEERLLQAQLKSIELFISNIREMRKKESVVEKTSEKSIVFWGKAAYRDVISPVLVPS